MSKPDFVYTTYIKTTPEKLWDAITNPEFTRQYWGFENRSDWQVGSKWEHVNPKDQDVYVEGEVLESNPPKRLVFSWVDPDDRQDVSGVIFEISTYGEMVCLEVTHGNFTPDSEMAGKVVKGWPRVLSSLKTYLETGASMEAWIRGEACASKA
jgi:uncharacterized protein YndB with AHSA1/START domain